MNILIVTDPENNPIHRYAAKCTDDMFEDVETAFEDLGIKTSEDLIEEIAQELMHGRNYWHDETLCFEVVTVFES